VIKRKTRHGILLLSSLAVISWLLTRDPAETGETPPASVDTRLNYAMWDFTAVLLDDEGRVNLQIDSPKLRKNALSEIGTVESPQILIQQDKEEWHITAESAIITADREHVSLVGDVNMLRMNYLTSETMVIITQDVMLNVTPRTASTESEVSILQAGDRLDALGMRLDMMNDSFELLENVRAHYAIP
jgi:LPS export ABC transporter protein LptC